MFYRYVILLIPMLWIVSDQSWEGTNAENRLEVPCKSYYNSSLKKNIYTEVEIEPAFAGGAVAYVRFLNKNMRYPQQQLDEDNLQSSVIMSFIVDTDGQIITPRIDKKSDTADYTPFEKEVVRILKLMPKWEPAICQGTA